MLRTAGVSTSSSSLSAAGAGAIISAGLMRMLSLEEVEDFITNRPFYPQAGQGCWCDNDCDAAWCSFLRAQPCTVHNSQQGFTVMLHGLLIACCDAAETVRGVRKEIT